VRVFGQWRWVERVGEGAALARAQPVKEGLGVGDFSIHCKMLFLLSILEGDVGRSKERIAA
jgi:hypothetical protein